MLALLIGSPALTCRAPTSLVNDSVFDMHVVVTTEAMGARCAVTADLDNDGDLDLISASSTDNAVAWYENLGEFTFSGKTEISFASNGARIVTTADIDGDGDIDVIAASYYDNTVRWFENRPNQTDRRGALLGRFVTSHIVTTSAANAQGVVAADIDRDGDIDLATASSGDNTVAWYENLGGGVFCELKTVVDDNAVGVRTVVAADLDGDGMVDLASASKDDNTIAWYPQGADGRFDSKVIISDTALGAYSLVAIDVDQDGLTDLVTASNGDDTVAIYRNLGTAMGSVAFERIVVYNQSDFVLSVFASDFDLDGDIDVASASYFDGAVRWYENDGTSRGWTPHTVYQQPGAQGHHVYAGDMDGDGDDDLIAITTGENAVNVFRAATRCDNSSDASASACCRTGQRWDGMACVACPQGHYGVGRGASAQCVACPTDACFVAGLARLPESCAGVLQLPICSDFTASLRRCTCHGSRYKDAATDTCVDCPVGQMKLDPGPRVAYNRTSWAGFEDTCFLAPPPSIPRSSDPRGPALAVGLVALVLLALLVAVAYRRNRAATQKLHRLTGAMGLQMPTFQWQPTKNRFGTFLSHYKVEAGSDARFMREVLIKMWGGRTEVFLDSQNLTDFRLLIADGVKQSDTVLVLGTRRVLQRPWCLLEIHEAVQAGIPVELCLIHGNPLDVADAVDFVVRLDVRLEEANPGAYAQLVQHVGRRREKLLRATLRAVVEGWHEAHAAKKTPIWHPHASDVRLVADAKDISEMLARATEQQLCWTDPPTRRERKLNRDGSWQNAPELSETSKRRRLPAAANFSRRSLRENSPGAPALYLTAAQEDAGSDARVLQGALAEAGSMAVLYQAVEQEPAEPPRLSVAKQQDATRRSEVGRCKGLVLLQTRHCLRSASVLCDVWEALKRELPIVPVVLDDPARSYNFEAAMVACRDIEASLRADDPAALAALQIRLGGEWAEFCVGVRTLPALLSTAWDPQGSDNHVKGVAADVVRTLRAKRQSLKTHFAELSVRFQRTSPRVSSARPSSGRPSVRSAPSEQLHADENDDGAGVQVCPPSESAV